jgi:hypothetical protein
VIRFNSEVVFVGGQRPPALFSVRPVGRGKARLHGVHRVPCLRRRDRGVGLRRRDRGLAYGGGTGVARDIEVYAHYGHEGGVD